MVARLGLSKVAYDWRNQHVASFEEEILQYKSMALNFLHSGVGMTHWSPLFQNMESSLRFGAP